jgi:hypothetical protein
MNLFDKLNISIKYGLCYINIGYTFKPEFST